MDNWIQDLKYGVRQWRRQPGFAIVALVTLGLSTGVAAALFSVIDGALIRTLPYPHPEQLVTVLVDEPARGKDPQPMRMGPSMADIRAWRGVSGILSHAGMGRVSGFVPLIVDAGDAERAHVATASEDFLETYGVTPILGRSIQLDDTREGAPAVALLGNAFWRRQFGSARDVIGKTIRIQDAPATIIGVLPAGFFDDTAVWKAQTFPSASLARRGSGTPVIARLQPGVTIAQALQALAPATVASSSGASKIELQTMYDDETEGYATTIELLASAVGLIVLIACVNVGGLLLARGASREAELSIRASIGASRGRLIRQLLTESLLLACGGAALGLLLAYASLDSLVAWIPLSLPANSPPAINGTVLAFSLALTVVTALLFGAIPAFKMSRAHANLSTLLAAGGRSGGGHLSRRAGQRLIGAEVALAVVLLAGAGLVVKSFAKLMAVDLGFDPSSVVALEVEPVDQTPAVRQQYYDSLVREIRQMPDVVAAGAVNQFALTGGSSFGQVTTDAGKDIFGPERPMLPGYFDALGVRPRAGRLPEDADVRAGGVAVVNQMASDQYFGGNAVGHSLIVGEGKTQRTLRIVGVIGDLRLSGPRGRQQADLFITPDPSGGQDSLNALAIIIRPRAGARLSFDRLKQMAESIGPRVVVGRVLPLEDLIGLSVATPRHRMLLLSLLGGFGLVLTLVGIFSMTAYAVARRTREIGVRIAFGAGRGDVIGAIVRDAVWPVAIGLAVGVAGAFYASRVITTFLYQTTPHDPATLATVVVTLGLAAGLAAWLPARRAATVDPVLALRGE